MGKEQTSPNVDILKLKYVVAQSFFELFYVTPECLYRES
jgi:hypothetical protein